MFLNWSRFTDEIGRPYLNGLKFVDCKHFIWMRDVPLKFWRFRSRGIITDSAFWVTERHTYWKLVPETQIESMSVVIEHIPYFFSSSGSMSNNSNSARSSESGPSSSSLGEEACDSCASGVEDGRKRVIMIRWLQHQCDSIPGLLALFREGPHGIRQIPGSGNQVTDRYHEGHHEIESMSLFRAGFEPRPVFFVDRTRMTRGYSQYNDFDIMAN